MACRVTEWEWPSDPLRDPGGAGSQKGIVIGTGRTVLKEVGSGAGQLPEERYLELFVKVDRDWQSRPKALERLGY